MLAGYARCSTDAQDLTAQHNVLTTFGVKANRIYVGHGLLARQRRAATLDLTTVLTTTVTTVAVPATPPTRPFAAVLPGYCVCPLLAVWGSGVRVPLAPL